MNLFMSAGVELPRGGRVARAVRVPLISHKVIKDVLTRIHFDSTAEQRSVAAKYAEIARSEKFKSMNEVQVRGRFYEDILCKVLGYSKVDPNNSYTLDVERAIRGGSVDIALGRFPNPDGKNEIIAPLEMKGPKTEDLEAVMPGRGRSPVQQAWDYAIDAPGSRWVLVSNCVELRLYSFGRGRDAYELFDLRKIDEESELERLWLILSANRFINGVTEELLRQSETAYKDITSKLYAEYAKLRVRLVIDPACGSGAFLVAAFDLLAREYRRAVDRLADLETPVDFDVFDEIITKNLYGVDLNAESVEITRLALWLKTARRQHRLQNLEATIKVGNSLITDAAFTDRPFSWKDAFPAQGGKFDIVIGNPPYVRSETISAIKPYLRNHYSCFDGGADLYCYFFEQGLSLLKDGGRLGFISSSGFFKTAFGGNLREYLRKNATFECGIDFGDARIFEDVTTYPAIVTFINEPSDHPYSFRFLNYEGDGTDDLAIRFNTDAFPCPSERLKKNRWHFEPEQLWKLRDTLERNAVGRLKDVAAPVSGIKTGLTEAFVLSREDKDQLTARDHESSKLIRHWTVGDDLNKWLPDPSDQYVLFIPKGWTQNELEETDERAAWQKFKARFPGAAKWLAPFEDDAKKRSDKGDQWWELRACDYYDLFDQELVTYPEMSQGPKFALKEKGIVSNNKTFLIPNSNPALLSILNSKASWFLLRGICTALRGGKWRLELRSDFLKDLPLPKMSKAKSNKLDRLAKRCKQLVERRDQAKTSVRKRLFDLSPNPALHTLTRKLEDWWELSFSDFLAEIRRAFRVQIALGERGKWESYLNENASEIRTLTAQIATVEREIDAEVYTLFGLNSAEISLLEESLQGQY